MRSLAASLLFPLAAALAGCAAEQPSPTVRLEISTNGTYVVDGVVVEKAALANALSKKRKPDAKLLVHIVPQNGAPNEAIRGAVEAAQNAGANIGMVGNALW